MWWTSGSSSSHNGMKSELIICLSEKENARFFSSPWEGLLCMTPNHTLHLYNPFFATNKGKTLLSASSRDATDAFFEKHSNQISFRQLKNTFPYSVISVTNRLTLFLYANCYIVRRGRTISVYSPHQYLSWFFGSIIKKLLRTLYEVQLFSRRFCFDCKRYQQSAIVSDQNF